MVTANGVRKVGSARVGRSKEDSSKRAVPAPPSIGAVNDSRKKEAVVRAAAKKDGVRSRSRSPGDLTRLPQGLVLKRSVTPQAHKRTPSVTPNAPSRTSSVRGARNSPRNVSPIPPGPTTRELIRGSSASPMFLRHAPASQAGSDTSRTTTDRSHQKEIQHLRQQLAKVTTERDTLRHQLESQSMSRRRTSSRDASGHRQEDPSQVIEGMGKDTITNFGIIYQDLAIDKGTVLGSGGFGTVYKGDYQATEVAVKIHRGDKAWTPEELDAWRREVRIMMMLRHPNVLMLLGACFEKDKLAIVTEYCEAGTLQELLQTLSRQGSQVPWHRKLKWMTEICTGMAFLHHKSVYHRDLKSANVFVQNDTMKIADFGLSRVEAPNQNGYTRPASARRDTQQPSLIQGTFAFMAPEVWAELPYTQACDVYSFGVLMIELIALDIPFERDFGDDCSWRIMTYRSKPKVLSAVGGVAIPQPVREILESCLSKPAHRPVFTALVVLLRDECTAPYASQNAPWPNAKYDPWVGVPCGDWSSSAPDPLSVTVAPDAIPE